MLNCLYSETNLFDKIEFKPGINIIQGQYSGTEKSHDINGIGKSSIARLIDLAFLSTSVKKRFQEHKYRFLSGHSFSLDITINGTQYTIKRPFDNFKRIYFGESNKKLILYDEDELKEIFVNKLFLADDYTGYINPTWFRDLMHFYVKDDLENRSRNDPLNFMSHTSRLPYRLALNFFLLGLPNKGILSFDKASQELRESRKIKKRLEKKLEDDTGKKLQEAQGELIEIEKTLQELEDRLQAYQFFKNYKDVEQELIKIAGDIASKNRQVHKLSKEREKYRKSFKIELETDVQKVTYLYQEVNRELGQFVQNELQKVLDFRREIVENRQKFLQKRLQKLDESINNLLAEINKLDKQRRKFLKFLDEQEALDSLKNTYNLLIEQKAKYEKSLSHIQQIKDEELEIATNQEQVSSAIIQLVKEVQGHEALIKNIKTLFYDIISRALFYDEDHQDVRLDIYAQSSKLKPASIDIEVPKSEALAQFVFKMLAYDLTVFLNSVHNQRKLPQFLIHDGVFHGVGKKTLINTLNYIHNQTRQYEDFQYIITLNENDLFISSEQKLSLGEFNFDVQDKTIAFFEDVPEKMFFKRSF